MGGVPETVRWLCWDVGFDDLEPERDADYLLPRILEFGGLAEVRWAMSRYGLDRIHRFLRDVGHPELSERTIGFWRAVLRAEDEAWASGPEWRTSKSAPWSA